MNLIAEAIKGHWGERCPDHHAECPACKAWDEFDKVVVQHEEQHKQVKMPLTEKERLSWIATLLSRGSEGDWRVRMAIALALGNSEEFLKWMLMQEV